LIEKLWANRFIDYQISAQIKQSNNIDAYNLGQRSQLQGPSEKRRVVCVRLYQLQICQCGSMQPYNMWAKYVQSLFIIN